MVPAGVQFVAPFQGTDASFHTDVPLASTYEPELSFMQQTLRPIIPYCLEHDEEGHKILSALRDWWKTGVNDVGVPRHDTISPIPEGILLLEAEKLAREREAGDGSMQRSVTEQLETVI